MAGSWTPGAWKLTAVVVLGLAVGVAFLDLWREDPKRFVAYTTTSPSGVPLRPPVQALNQQDAMVAAWLVPRNAYTFVSRPWRLFEAEHCAPHPKSLTLGAPMITMGLLAVPAWLVTGDPILTYNVSVVALALVAAATMYLLVTGWTGTPAAGIVAGLLYALAPDRMRDVGHSFIWDTAWTALALWFGQRLFAHGRWRDAILLACCVAPQLGASFYPALGAAFLLPPYVAWLVVHYGFRQVRVSQLVFVVASTLLSVGLVYGPFLGTLEEGVLRPRIQGFAAWARYGPGSWGLPGWIALALAASALLLGRRRSVARLDGDPRWALCIGALLVSAVAMFPTVYAALASVLPGMSVVRASARMMSGAYLALCVLAGLGAAAILRSLPARAALPAALVGIALVAFAANPSARSFGLVDARPSPQVTAFFEELERLGNTGPLLELPLFVEPMRRRVEANRMLAAAWHQRRTSSCVTSHLPPGYEEVALLARALPARRALAELERLGFTTLVVHRDTAGGVGVDSAFWRASRRGAPLLRLFATPSLAAYAIAFEDEAGRRVEPDVIRRYKLTLFGKRAVAVAGPEK